jgi:hypothetical protein
MRRTTSRCRLVTALALAAVGFAVSRTTGKRLVATTYTAEDVVEMVGAGGGGPPVPDTLWTGWTWELTGLWSAEPVPVGDVDGDGVDDLAWHHGGGQPLTALQLHLGAPGGPLLVPGQTLEVTAARYVGLGDVNGDGFHDVAAVQHPASGMPLATLYLGGPSGLSMVGLEVPAPAGVAAEALVTPAGDTNGDGYDDFVVSVPHEDAVVDYPGAAWLYLGSATPEALAPAVQWSGGAGQTGFGALVTAGDANGDRLSDVWISASSAGSGRGADDLWAWFPGGTGDPVVAPAALVDASLARPNAGLGGADLNGDGFDDLLLAAGSGRSRVSVLVVGGAAGPEVTPVAAPAMDGTSLWARAEALGDATGDGVDDVLLTGVAGEPGSYLVCVLNGGIGGQPATLGDCFNARLRGEFARVVGDVNGDGALDVAVGGSSLHLELGEAAVPCTLGPVPGSAFARDNDTSQDPDAFNNPPGETPPLRAASFRVRAVGDLDADGFDDVAVVAGDVWVYRGGPDGLSAVPDLVIPANLLGSASVGAGDMAGADLDGDGFDDLVISTPTFAVEVSYPLVEAPDQPVSYPRGAVFVFRGGPAGVAAVPDAVWVGVDLDSGFGSGLTSPGDVTGDGVDDLLVTAPGWLSEHNQGEVEAPRIELWAGGAALPTGPIASFPIEASFGADLPVGDFDGDGRGEALLLDHDAGSDQTTLSALRSGPGGATLVPLATLPGQGAVVAGDLDGDGVDDLWSDDVALFGARGFVPEPLDLSVSGVSKVHVLGDVDGDGRDDLFVTAALAVRPPFRMPTHLVQLDAGAGLAVVWVAPPWVVEVARDQPGAGCDGCAPTYRSFTPMLDRLGDVNGDGFNDIAVIGTSLVAPGRLDQPRTVWLWYGSPAGLVPVPGQQPPALSVEALSAQEGVPIAWTAQASDPDGEVVAVVWTLPGGQERRGLDLTHTFADSGPQQVHVEDRDDDGLVFAVSATVAVANLAPTIAGSPGPATEGLPWSFAPELTDPGDDPITVSIVQGPTGAGWVDGALVWTPADGLGGTTATFELRVEDRDGGVAMATWAVEVWVRDLDADGLPDGWEVAYGLDDGDPDDVGSDLDGDGRDALTEWTAGTDPTTWEGPPVPEPVVTGLPLGDPAELRWTLAPHPLGAAMTVEAEVVRVADGSERAHADGLAGEVWSAGPLPENELVSWSLRAYDGTTSSAWSTPVVQQVDALAEPPTAPVLVGPVGGVDGAVQPTLQWTPGVDPEGGPLTHEVELEAEGGSAYGRLTEDGPLLSWAPEVSLVEDAVLTWRVRALDVSGLGSTWSETAFVHSTVNTAPSAVVPASPVDGETRVDPAGPLRVVGAMDPEGQPMAVRWVLTAGEEELDGLTEVVDGGSTLQLADPLSEQVVWTARAAAEDAGGVVGPWTAWSFRTAGPDLPSEAPEQPTASGSCGCGTGGGSGLCGLVLVGLVLRRRR